jgi:hypothetical protein
MPIDHDAPADSGPTSAVLSEFYSSCADRHFRPSEEHFSRIMLFLSILSIPIPIAIPIPICSGIGVGVGIGIGIAIGIDFLFLNTVQLESLVPHLSP